MEDLDKTRSPSHRTADSDKVFLACQKWIEVSSHRRERPAIAVAVTLSLKIPFTGSHWKEVSMSGRLQEVSRGRRSSVRVSCTMQQCMRALTAWAEPMEVHSLA